MRRLLFILFIVLSASALLLAKPPKMPKPKKGTDWVDPFKPKPLANIYGNWIWKETDCCGARRGISNPENTNDAITLELKSDNTFLETHAKSTALPRSGTVIMFKENNIDMVQFNDERPAQYFLSNNGDTLTLSWKYMELQTEKYIRKK